MRTRAMWKIVASDRARCENPAKQDSNLYYNERNRG